jgi:hypothetical protein
MKKSNKYSKMKYKTQLDIMMKSIFVVGLSILQYNFIGCSRPDSSSDSPPLIDDENPPIGFYVLPNHPSPVHYPGIPIYTANMAKDRSTDVNSEWVIRKSQNVNVSSEIVRKGFNALHKISFRNLNANTDYFELVMALHGKLVNRMPVPEVFVNNLTGISFRAVSYLVPVSLSVEAYDINGALIKNEIFQISKDDMQTYTMQTTNQQLHHVKFKVLGEHQEILNFADGAIGIDDVYLTNSSTVPFQPPTSDAQILDWLQTSSIQYFIWNYRDIGGGMGTVLEASDATNKVSLSGIGYAYAIYILAEQENLISSALARQRILSMLKWQEAQNWFNGSDGIYGFPYHYFDLNGNGLYNTSPEAVSTIDWAMCAAGIRTVKQKYAADNDIVTICNTLLNRPQWIQTIHNNPNDSHRNGRITKGFSSSGVKNGQVWGDAFSEETEIIYLEALASRQVDNIDLDRIFRAQKNGFYVSWFGSGFTYNWMQLWTGPVNPYQSNSVLAYQADATTSLNIFGQTYIGLTACATLSSLENNGFVNWNNYVGNQGSSVSGATQNEVTQMSPAPYGAALALPFIPTEAVQSLRNYIAIGYFHPLLGLPDNIRMKQLPEGLNIPLPNWNTFDINIGSVALAINQYQHNTISQYYLTDPNVAFGLQNLINSF